MVFQDVFQEIVREAFQEVIQEVFRDAFQKIGWLKKPLAKVVDFVPLGALSGPGPPDPDLAHFQIRV